MKCLARLDGRGANPALRGDRIESSALLVEEANLFYLRLACTLTRTARR